MKSRKRSISDKYLIAEQPGMRILISGFILSFFIGFTIKSILNPARVASRIEKAASHIHKDVKVSFASASVSLMDGILPRFSVVITQVRMESEKKCWAAPILEVDELRLPLSIWNILTGQAPIQDIQAENVKLVLRENFGTCDLEEAVESQKTPPPLVSLSPAGVSQKYQNDVRGVQIRNLRIISEKHPQYSSEFLNFDVKVKSFEPKVVEVTAKTHLLKDEQVGDYLSHANLYIQYKESPEATVQAHFFGNWREGHYSFITNYNLAERVLSVETDLKHIPLSQILGILQKYDLASKELNGRQVWISSKARLTSVVEKIRSAPLEVRDLRLEGDLGEMKVDHIDVISLEPFKYAPIYVDIKKLDVAKLLVLLNRPKNTSMLAGLGSFAGRAEVFSDENMKLIGEHSGLEFVFSNKGQRELQIMERMVGDISYQGKTWNFNLKRIEPRGGTFIGSLNMKADRDFKEVELKTRVDELSLSSEVQKLMTNYGDIGFISLDLDARIKDGEANHLKGLVRIDNMDVEGVRLTKTKASVDYQHGEIILNTQVNSLDVASDSVGVEVLRNITEKSWWKSGALTMNALTGRFVVKSKKEFSWKSFQGKVGKTGRLVTEGAWNEEGILKGSVHINDGKVHRQWLIEGTRESPVFVENAVKSSRK